ncbi:hypothetical protein GGR42_000917 [Saonia flava]|uniref:Uncharacterized protein n=1 Tax=Saonia flava TaxID=523696 RepID=A0A846QXU5_9FLAO|nr:hypothetical protein [Saonia flava]
MLGSFFLFFFVRIEPILNNAIANNYLVRNSYFCNSKVLVN